MERRFVHVTPSELSERSRRLRELLLIGASRLVAVRVNGGNPMEPERAQLAAGNNSGSSEELAQHERTLEGQS